ncbi:Predicted arabinose efflux permease, MFS family [Micromonospora echinaurantiaca]|uniref:Predicted arabinose efflux permease, MFS family n=1 Tax=Micromonospora echinaurantiaca TaxID=47857 RepID=A0A1C5IEK7_9ACTN|nr:MFS transporter [Micromonospora echinaurantiaca]SCG56888.1 Predicted arabinose efflux permease, MFS family [Micromonospora echinaurantiaca]
MTETAPSRTTSRRGAHEGRGEAWKPFAAPVFRALWIAQFVSNIGTWMSTVAAQWELVGRSPVLVSLVQTSASLPLLLLAFPAGVLADQLDRRRLLITAQYAMLGCSAVLAGLAFADVLQPASLLTLLFLTGCGSALMGPAWQAIQPELVDRPSLPQAAALGAVSMNLARAVGPALGGLLLSLTGTGWVFTINALSYLGTVAVLAAWHRPPGPRETPSGDQRLLTALDAGRRYVWHSPDIRGVLWRCLLFVPAASALWALLPLVASRSLGLGASGYGLLLGAVGAGAVVGAVLLPSMRRVWGAGRSLAFAGLAAASVLTLLTLTRTVWAAVLLLPAAGLAWILVVSLLSATMQTRLPAWVRARGLAVYLVVFQGGMALAAPVWGLLADRWGLAPALLTSSVALLLGAASVRWWPLPGGSADTNPSSHWPEPVSVLDPQPHGGPVLVTVEYRVATGDIDRFIAAMTAVARSRRRTGAVTWGLYRDSSDPERLIEHYVVVTWNDHLAQHRDRLTADDRRAEQVARALLKEGTKPTVAHAFDAMTAT